MRDERHQVPVEAVPGGVVRENNRHPFWPTFVILVVALVLVLGACGGGSTPQKDPPKKSATAGAPVVDETPEPTAATNFFAVNGEVSFSNKEGYSMLLGFRWAADEPFIDVGANPPGKTNILIAAQPFEGTLTNTTAGGREMPLEQLPLAKFVALYSADSAVCTQDGDALLLDSGFGGNIRTSGFCAVSFLGVLGGPRADGRLDMGASVPNGVPIAYSYGDLAASAASALPSGGLAQPVDAGPSWTAVDEAQSESISDAIAHPIAFGIGTFDNKPTGTMCTYTDGGNGDTHYIALLDSNLGTSVPGCDG